MIKAKKQLGQNFLTDTNKLNEIVDSLNLTKEMNIFEVGPGLGAITYPMARRAKHVTAVEIDEDAIAQLVPADNLTIIHEDILKFDIEGYIKGDYTFVSNLPYYISSKILFKVFIEK